MVLLAVPEARRAVPTVPELMLEAFKLVKFVPETAGSVAGKRASGTVPEAKLEAFKLVKLAPDTAGRVAGNLASGTVPEVKAVAFKLVRLVPEIAGNVAGNLASGTVPEARLEAFNDVTPEPAPVIVVNVPVLAVKLPEASRATIVEAPLAEAAVVLALSKVPVVMLDALRLVIPEPAPVMVVNVPTLAEKLPFASRAMIVEAPLEAVAVVAELATLPAVVIVAK